MIEWQAAHTAPDGVEVDTAVFHSNGVSNHQPLVRQGRLWFFPDHSMYVYYEPTHWREMQR